MGHGMTAAFVLSALLLSATQGSPELEPAKDALRRHDYVRSAELLSGLAERGNAEAAYQLALLYLPRSNDVGLPPDAARACHLLVESAGLGWAKAAYTLAAQVESGICPSTGRTAAEWSAVASSAGFAPHAASTAPVEPGAVADPATLLRRWAHDGNLSKLTALLETVPADTVGSDHRAALHDAAEFNQPDAAQILLSHRATVDLRDSAGDTPLLIAARSGASAVVKLLIAAGANVNAVDIRGGTPLMLAAAAGSPETVDVLVAHGADPNVRNAQGLAAMDLAERAPKSGQTSAILAALKSAGATGVARVVVRETRSDDRFAGWSGLLIACERGDVAAVKAALGSGANPNSTEPLGTPALGIAAQGGHVAVVQALLWRARGSMLRMPKAIRPWVLR